MMVHNLEDLRYPHDFYRDNDKAEKRTVIVIVITALMMAFEIAGGAVFGSLALLADGIHMGTHAAALLITVFAYIYARKNRDNESFTFGTGKVGVLGGYTSAICLGLAAFVMIYEAIQRFISPVTIRFEESIFIAVVGLVVNAVCALFLGGHHHHGTKHSHEGHHHDHNLKAAYVHIVTDAVTSVFAIFALLGGYYFKLYFLDPLMGVVGAVVIFVWAFSLIKETTKILTDGDVSPDFIKDIKNRIESDNDNLVVDLHVWKIDSDNYSVEVALLTHVKEDILHYRQLLKDIPTVKHCAFEINLCSEKGCRLAEG